MAITVRSNDLNFYTGNVQQLLDGANRVPEVAKVWYDLWTLGCRQQWRNVPGKEMQREERELMRVRYRL